MYILDKEKLKKTFKDYADLEAVLKFNSLTSFRKDRGGNILDDDVILCPDNIRKRLDKYGYKELYYTVDEQILINAMIYGNRVVSNDVMRIIVGLMLNGLTEKPPHVYWSVEELLEESEYKISKKSIKSTIAKEHLYFVEDEDSDCYRLNVRALTQSCQ